MSDIKTAQEQNDRLTKTLTGKVTLIFTAYDGNFLYSDKPTAWLRYASANAPNHKPRSKV